MISLMFGVALISQATSSWDGKVEAAPRTIRSFSAAEATQGVAVDADSIYVIADDRIGRYDRRTQQKLAEFVGSEASPVKHMNGGVVYQGKLWCSHSNFPDIPMSSSVEVFDAKTLRHVESHSFGPFGGGLNPGSLVWLDQRPGEADWYVCFGHYNAKGGEPGMLNNRTVLIRMDREWRPKAAYSFPKELIERLDGMTLSGGVWGQDGKLYATGHHAPEIYVLALPKAGAFLKLERVIASPVEGQGLAIDNATGELFQMRRKDRSIYVLDLLGKNR